MKTAICYLPIFGRTVVAATECSQSEAVLQFAQLQRDCCGGTTGLNEIADVMGWCQCRGGDIYVWSENSPAVLFHELVHAAFMLCRQANLPQSEELIARLLEHMKLYLVDKLYYPGTTGTDLEAGRGFLKGHSLAEGMATFLGEK
ncbi:MAG: hypothetical protein RBR35_19710 [Salinivirgaceae bacterium]|nr:hypothetical protein [Salinivirgaceae bacterium]